MMETLILFLILWPICTWWVKRRLRKARERRAMATGIPSSAQLIREWEER